ncbi:hypothetical protein Bbelb_295500 [Branchiostoma belcheri]|nr:hypothetical protein Bbelb_295500 [Branchiostoma belcheri]
MKKVSDPFVGGSAWLFLISEHGARVQHGLSRRAAATGQTTRREVRRPAGGRGTGEDQLHYTNSQSTRSYERAEEEGILRWDLLRQQTNISTAYHTCVSRYLSIRRPERRGGGSYTFYSTNHEIIEHRYFVECSLKCTTNVLPPGCSRDLWTHSKEKPKTKIKKISKHVLGEKGEQTVEVVRRVKGILPQIPWDYRRAIVGASGGPRVGHGPGPGKQRPFRHHTVRLTGRAVVSTRDRARRSPEASQKSTSLRPGTFDFPWKMAIDI